MHGHDARRTDMLHGEQDSPVIFERVAVAEICIGWCSYRLGRRLFVGRSRHVATLS